MAPDRHVILIDDAHCFGSSTYYPTLDAVRDLAAKHYPGATMEVRNNIIRIHKGSAEMQSLYMRL